MNGNEYRSDLSVRSFLGWVEPLLSGDRPFAHAWISLRHGAFRCDTLFNAYERYRWSFRVHIPGDAVQTVGSTFAESFVVLDRLSGILRGATEAVDTGRFVAGALAVLEWGGVTSQNAAWLSARTPDEVREIIEVAKRLDPSTADDSRFGHIPRLNSGFTKIYSLMLDDFPIYDSRVAAALALLIRRYCAETRQAAVPLLLQFRLPPSRGSGRSLAGFPAVLRTDQFAVSNIRAAWLMNEMSRWGRFGELPPANRMRALEAALFMVGFRVI